MATNENIRVVQLTDDNDNPVSPVVNVGSLYDKNGNKVDNLLSYKVAGTDVPVPEIKNVEAELTAKVDAKLAELDAVINKIESAAQTEVVSYVGNGTYGSDNPCTLTFSFTPTLVRFIGMYGSGNTAFGGVSPQDDSYQTMVHIRDVTNSSTEWKNTEGFCYTGKSGAEISTYGKFDKSTNTLYWYSTKDESVQLNASNVTYYFMAIK